MPSRTKITQPSWGPYRLLSSNGRNDGWAEPLLSKKLDGTNAIGVGLSYVVGALLELAVEHKLAR